MTYAPLLVAVALGASWGGAVVLKGDCVGAHTDNWRSRLCYNDVQPLYYHRGIDHGVFPYVHATLVHGRGAHGFNEYPVMTGVVMWATGRVVWSGSSYLVATMILLAACAGLTAWLLWRMVGLRAVSWSASPILLIYAFHNWDLLAVTASVVGIFCWRRGQPALAAFAFAVGGAFKLYPALFIIPLVCDQLVHHRPRRAAGVGLVGYGGLAMINLPFIVVNAAGWWATYRFHSDRGPSTNGTVWSVLDNPLSTSAANRAGALALAVALVGITLGLLAARSQDAYPVIEWCAAATAAFIVLNKANSPQYILWILPFLALLRVRAAWWWLLSAVAIVRYVGLFGVGTLSLGLHTADHLARTAAALEVLLLTLFAIRLLTPNAAATSPGVLSRG